MAAVAPTPVIEQWLSVPGTASLTDARAWVRRLTESRRENFTVLSRLVPPDVRGDFAAVYAFCRVSDDLADEGGTEKDGTDEASRQAALSRLERWRAMLRESFAGTSTHPLFVALHETIRTHRLPRGPFDDLLDAFTQDQRMTRYEHLDGLLDYSTRSANPVGHLVLMMLGMRPPEESPSSTAMWRESDLICTALQLTNFWQDVARDLLERDRIYLPLTQIGLEEAEIRAWVTGSAPVDAAKYQRAMQPLWEATQRMFEQGSGLVAKLQRTHRPVIRLFLAGGTETLDLVRRRGAGVLRDRPKLGRGRRAWLVVREHLRVVAGI